MFAMILDVLDESGQARGQLVVGLRDVCNARGAQIDFELQMMKRTIPREHLRMDESVRASDSDAGDVRVVFDILSGKVFP